MKESRGQYLAKNTLIFSIGNFGSKLVSFLLVPLYTNVLSTDDYGVADLITTMCGVLAPILILNISEAIFRFQLDKNADKRAVFKIGLRFLMLSLILGLLFIPVYLFIPPIKDYAIYMYVYNVSIGACTLFLYDLRGKEMLLKYSIGGILLTLLSSVFNIVFLVIIHLGLKGYLLSLILANLITSIYCVIASGCFKNLSKSKIDNKLLIEMVKFSVVLIPNTFMWWIMNSSDRLMVSMMVGTSQAGIYAISYKLPTLVSILTGIFNQAWSYSAIHEHGSKDEKEYNNRVFISLISMSMLLGLALLAIMKPFLKIYVEPSYYEAWKYTPFLIVGCVYLTMGTFMSTTYNVHKDSMGFLISASLGAFTNVVLNFALIPHYEVYGAAIATCVSYFVVFIFRYFHTRKYIVFDVKNKEFFIGSGLLIVSSILMYFESIVFIVIQFVIIFVGLILYSSTWIPLFKFLISKIVFNKKQK